jgi:hypothetical protein
VDAGGGQVNELVKFLQARLDEDEEAAREAMRYVEGSWSAHRGAVLAPLHGLPAGDGQAFKVAPGTQPHIVRHDPERVLADVAAKRRVVERYLVLIEDFAPVFETATEYARRLALEEVLEDLASAYDAHGDHPEVWR